MKTIRVVAAVICDSFLEKKRIFATARGYGEFKGQWEFPGGKLEAGETSEQALIREILEELDADINDLGGRTITDYKLEIIFFGIYVFFCRTYFISGLRTCCG